MAAPYTLHPYDGTSSSSSEEWLHIQQVADVFTTTTNSSDSESTTSEEITLQQIDASTQTDSVLEYLQLDGNMIQAFRSNSPDYRGTSFSFRLPETSDINRIYTSSSSETTVDPRSTTSESEYDDTSSLASSFFEQQLELYLNDQSFYLIGTHLKRVSERIRAILQSENVANIDGQMGEQRNRVRVQRPRATGIEVVWHLLRDLLNALDVLP